MQRRNTSLLFAVVAAVVLAAVLWRLANEDPAPRPEPDGEPSPAAAPDAAPGGGGSPPVSSPFDGPRVRVSLESRERFRPPSDGGRPRVQAVALPNRTPLPTAMLVGTGANPWADAPRPGVALVKIEIDGGFLVRQAAVATAGVTELGVGSTLAVTGTVQDAAGEPVAGARVWLGELDGDGRTRHLRTDERGVFETRVRAGDGVPLTVWAQGHAATWRPIDVQVDVGRHHAISLPPGGTLAVQLAGAAENVELAELVVAPAGARAAELSRYPFFLQEIVGGAAVNASGLGTVPFLPRHGAIAVHVLHPQVAIGRPHEVTLDGERTACVVQQQFAAAWSATLQNDAGEPLSGAAVVLRPAGRAISAGTGLDLLPPRLEARGCYFATTDAEGRFTCAAPRPGDVVSLRAPGHGGRDLEIAGDPPPALWLPAWVGGDLRLTVEPPAAGVAWRAEFAVADGVVVEAAPDEPAVIALPHPGLFDIVVTTFVGDEERGRADYAGVAATGPVVVPAPAVE